MWNALLLCALAAVLANGAAKATADTQGRLLMQSGDALAAAWQVAGDGNGAGPGERREALLSFWEAGNALVLYGGRDTQDNIYSDVWAFDIAARTWTELFPNDSSDATQPAPRFSTGGGVDQGSGQLVVFAGETDDKVVLNDLWSFDLASKSWRELNDGTGQDAPEPRYGHAAGVVSLAPNGATFLAISHGFDRSKRWQNTFVFNLGQNAWIEVTPTSGAIPSARCLVAGAAMADPANPTGLLLGMYGGCGSGGYGPCPSSEMWTLSLPDLNNAALPATEQLRATWTMAETCVRARNYGAMAADPTRADGTFFLYGGSGGPLVPQDEPGQLNTISMDSYAWSQVVFDGTSDGAQPPQPTGNQQSAMATSPGGLLWLQLGQTNDIYLLNYSAVPSFADANQQSCHNDPIPAWRTAHGVLMALSWGFLLPIGVFIARFGRIQNPLWFKLHRGIQSLGLTLGVMGFVAAILMVSTGKFLAAPHSFIGIAVTFLGIQQPLNAFFRPHAAEKGAPKARSRVCWEFWHKYSGRVALVLGLINPFWGISYLSGVNSGGFIAYAVWVAIYALAFAYLSARGLPYQANGPSALAGWLNATLCCCLTPWDDSFKPRNVGAGADSRSQNGDEEQGLEDDAGTSLAK